MELEVKERDFTLVSDKSKVNFCELAGGVVTANIESLYIRNYEVTMTVFKFKIFSRTLYSNLRVFLVILWSFLVILWSFLKLIFDRYHTNSYAAFFSTLRLHASDSSEIRKNYRYLISNGLETP
jgi:sensor histidine kinase YesM